MSESGTGIRMAESASIAETSKRSPTPTACPEEHHMTRRPRDAFTQARLAAATEKGIIHEEHEAGAAAPS